MRITRYALTALALVMVIGCGQSQDALLQPEVTAQCRPWTRWWWPGSAFQPSDIDYALAQYSEVGLGGVEVTPIYGARGYEQQYRDFLSPEWMELLSHALDKAGQLGMGVDLANASGWPFGGPWVTPDYACRYLAHKTYHLSGGESLSEPISYVETPMVRTVGQRDDLGSMTYPIATNDSLQVHAYEQVRYPLELPLLALTGYGPNGEYVELTDWVQQDGTLDWTAPSPGDWTLCAMFLGWHGKMVERAGPGGEGDVMDHFSERATRQYLSKFDQSFEGYDLSSLRYYFNDSYEVDDAVGNSDWTQDFFEQFESRRWYDLKRYMPVLLDPHSTDISAPDHLPERVLYDYRLTIGELLTDSYARVWHDWAAAQGKGIRNQAHGSPANILDLYALSDVPETEGYSIIGMKTASSAAHIADKPLTSSETATWLDDHFCSTLSQVKSCVDDCFLAGVNHIFYHGTCLTPQDAPWPGWLFYAAVHFEPTNSIWDDLKCLNEYVARTQSFLQTGRPDNDLLLFFDSTDLLSTIGDERGRDALLYHMTQYTPAQSAIGASAQALCDQGYSWDYVSDHLLQDQLQVHKGQIVTKGGNAYRAIVVPHCQMMELESFEKLLSLAEHGATVMIEGGLPGDVPGLSGLETKRARLADLKSRLKFDDRGIAKWGRGLIMVSEDLEQMLRSTGITRETMYDLGLKCIRRLKDDGGRYYFLKNTSEQTVETYLTLGCSARSVGIFDPMTGRSGYGRMRGDSSVFVRLRSGESLVLETFDRTHGGEAYEFYEPTGEELPVEGEWTVSFTKGGPTLPEPVRVSTLGSWTEYGEPYRDFSGSAEYSIRLGGVEGENWILTLGDVRSSARVYLDDELIGTVIGSPYEVMLSAEQAQRGGLLRVVVSSTCHNRIAYMDRTGQPWKIFYNANIAARTRESRGPDGYFTAADYQVEPCGLLGPVVLKKSQIIK